MHLEAYSGIAYTKIMAFLCVLILWATQILIYIILKKLNVRTTVCIMTLAYFAISPAMNNTAFSLYSEIAALPLVLLAALGEHKSVSKHPNRRCQRRLTCRSIFRIGFYRCHLCQRYF